MEWIWFRLSKYFTHDKHFSVQQCIIQKWKGRGSTKQTEKGGKNKKKHTAGPMSWYLNSISFKGMELITRTTGGERLVISMSTLRWWSCYLTYGRYGGTQPNPLCSDLLHQLLWQLLSASLWGEMGITLGSTTAAALNAQKIPHYHSPSTGLLLCHIMFKMSGVQKIVMLWW